jgi:hypothetical protein
MGYSLNGFGAGVEAGDDADSNKKELKFFSDGKHGVPGI